MSSSGALRALHLDEDAWRSQSFYGTAYGGATTANLAGFGALVYVPLFVPKATAIDRIGMEVTGAGDVGSVIRLGAYRDDGQAQPSTLLFDAGTIDGTSVTVQQITIAQTLPPGRVWLACVAQGGTVQPVVRCSTNFLDGNRSVNLNNLTANVVGDAADDNVVAGALPANATVTSRVPWNRRPVIGVRAA